MHKLWRRTMFKEDWIIRLDNSGVQRQLTQRRRYSCDTGSLYWRHRTPPQPLRGACAIEVGSGARTTHHHPLNLIPESQSSPPPKPGAVAQVASSPLRANQPPHSQARHPIHPIQPAPGNHSLRCCRASQQRVKR